MPVLKVTSYNEQARFDRIWMPSWIDQEYELESYMIPGLERYIFFNTQGDYGSIELVPYKANPEWPINETFPFNEFIGLRNRKVVEIEKLAIKKDSRGSLRFLYEMMSFVTEFALRRKIDYYIILLNPSLYKVMVWRFKLPIKRLMKAGIDNLPYYPTIIDVQASKESIYYQKYKLKKNGKSRELNNGE